MTLNFHLNFDGICKQAFEFYEQCLGQKITFMQTYGDSPGGDQMPPEMRSKVMHTSIMVGNVMLMGADSPSEEGKPQGFAVTVATADPAEAERVFAALADGGDVRMPLGETFWAQRFGMLTDKFGVPWMINCGKEGIGGQ
jgi:PhnB protein